MKFIDRATLIMKGGNGGSGAVSFRREKYVPLGGPDGGDGGRGGSVILVGNEGMNTLYDIRYRQTIAAKKGVPGGGQKKYGKKGADEIVHLPAGTLVYNDETGELIADITAHQQRIVIAEGGIGGRGNAKFKSSTNKAPHYAQEGLPGEIIRIRLELKLLADVGIIGYPSVGKSTFIAKISNARPKIAEYHFTTLVPNLGLVESPLFPPFIVADIPGLIEGAHAGQGLGHRFLRHVERSRILLHMVEITPSRTSPIEDIDAINRELILFNKDLSSRDQVIVLNKTDTLNEADDELREQLQESVSHLPYFEISAVTGEGVDAVLRFVAEKVRKASISKAEQSDQRILDRYTPLDS